MGLLPVPPPSLMVVSDFAASPPLWWLPGRWHIPFGYTTLSLIILGANTKKVILLERIKSIYLPNLVPAQTPSHVSHPDLLSLKKKINIFMLLGNMLVTLMSRCISLLGQNISPILLLHLHEIAGLVCNSCWA